MKTKILTDFQICINVLLSNVFMDNIIPSGFTVLLASPEAATRVILYKKLLLKIS